MTNCAICWPTPLCPDRGLRSEMVAKFYRFLVANGKLIPAQNTAKAGLLAATDEARLSLAALPAQPQIGYMTLAQTGGDVAIAEVIVVPILSQETGEGIAALVLGFDPVQLDSRPLGTDFVSGIWFEGELFPATFGKLGSRELGQGVEATDRGGSAARTAAARGSRRRILAGADETAQSRDATGAGG